jgi:hypothetical protein
MYGASSDRVILSGIDKVTFKRITLTLSGEEFDEWMSGIPLRYAFPNLTMEERRFLRIGTKQLSV